MSRLAANSHFLLRSYSATYHRSSTLDRWQLKHLRTMKVGGNRSATEFFTKNGGASLLSDSDTRKKYSSPIAERYKEELARRVREDAAKCALSSPFHR